MFPAAGRVCLHVPKRENAEMGNGLKRKPPKENLRIRKRKEADTNKKRKEMSGI